MSDVKTDVRRQPVAALTKEELAASELSVALIGNPNTGKTTVFNRLTGFRARVGNYAGVTVEHKVGRLKGSKPPVRVVDLPGTYSLAVQSEDERVAVDVLMGRSKDEPRPDVIVVVVDATNLYRNLYLVSQLIDLGRPMAVVLNMMDAARDREIVIDAARLAAEIGLPVFATVARTGEGFEPLEAWLRTLGEAGMPDLATPTPFSDDFESKASELAAQLSPSTNGDGAAEGAAHPESGTPPLFVARRLLLDSAADPKLLAPAAPAGIADFVAAARESLAESGHRLETLEARTRYAWIRERITGIVETPGTSGPTTTERIDSILLHKFAGPVVLVLFALLVFQSIYTWSGPAMDAIDGLFGALAGWAEATLPAGPLTDLLTGGIIAGVGGVIIFLPQIIILFLFIALLEDCGYMARAAFLMDRAFSRIGLTGRSFIPMLSSFACAIPGVMAARTISDPKDRLATIMVAPLMSCSARLPVYTVLIGAFVPATTIVPGFLGLQGLTLFAMYMVGIVVAIPVAMLLRMSVLKGEVAPFLMELPDYRMPHWPTVIHRVYERAKAFVVRAGTLILAVSIIVWAAAYFPRADADMTVLQSEAQFRMTEFTTSDKVAHLNEVLERPEGVSMDEFVGGLSEEAIAADPVVAEYAELLALQAAEDEAVAMEEAGRQIRQSFLGRMGHAIEPIVKPLGWDWKIGMAVVASFPAREVVIATLGVIYDVGEADEESTDLRDKLKAARNPDGSPVFTLPVALGIMVFFALCAQCAATIAIIWRETNTWKWAAFSFGYMTVLAYVGAFATYHVARLLLG